MNTGIFSLILAMVSVTGLRAGTAPELDAVRVASGLTRPILMVTAKADMLWQNNSGMRAVWLMNGTNYVSGVYLGTVGTSWNIANY